MAATGVVTLGNLRLQAQQRSDKVGSNFITVPEWNTMLNASYKELYDILVTTYGSDFYVAAAYQFATVANTQTYPLPDGVTTISLDTGLVAAPFYKLYGVDLQVTPDPNSWITLKRYEFADRNKYWKNNSTAYTTYGYTDLRYKVVGDNIWLTTIPAAGQTIQLWYIPQPVNLQQGVVGSFTSGSPTVTIADTSALEVGMSLDNQYIPTSSGTPATILSIVTNTSFTMSANATASATSQNIFAWSDTASFDGISGWEEYIVIDAAIKANLKEETDTATLQMQKLEMKKRIEGTAPNRDAAMAPCVSDNVSEGGFRGGGGFGGGDEW